MKVKALVNGVITEVEVDDYTPSIADKQAEIEELKAELSQYDYIGVKIAMGVATKEEYADKIAYTETLRAKINQLQSEIGE